MRKATVPQCRHKDRKHYARGRCLPCYHSAWRNGSIEDYPRITQPRKPTERRPTARQQEYIDEIEAGTVTKLSEAWRFGVTEATLKSELYRAHRADLVRRLRRGEAL